MISQKGQGQIWEWSLARFWLGSLGVGAAAVAVAGAGAGCWVLRGQAEMRATLPSGWETRARCQAPGEDDVSN